jgi:hypothetical protein
MHLQPAVYRLTVEESESLYEAAMAGFLTTRPGPTKTTLRRALNALRTADILYLTRED